MKLISDKKRLKKLSKQIDKYEREELTKILFFIRIIFSVIYGSGILLFIITQRSYGSKHFMFIALLLGCFVGTVVLVTLLLKWLVGKKNKVTEIASVGAYIRTEVQSVQSPSGGVVHTTYYYLDIVSSSTSLPSVVINHLQEEKIANILANEPNKYIECDVAFVLPKKLEKLNPYAARGTLCLLPFDEYFIQPDELIVISDEQWLAPEQREQQPSFTLPRKEINTQSPSELICEAKLDPSMEKMEFSFIEEGTLRDKTDTNDKSITNVISYSGNITDGFIDFRTRIRTNKDRKGPSFITYCLIAYAVNYFIIDSISAWPNLYFYLNILITMLVVGAIVSFSFMPFKVNLPVRFHRKNKEIYVCRGESLYKIPWEQSDFSVVARQVNKKVSYELNLWLDPKYDVNRKSTSFVPLTFYRANNKHGRVFFFWDYINRYMKFDPYFKVNITKSEEKETKDEKQSLLGRIFGETIAILFIPILIIFIFSDANELRAKLNPFKTKWPKSVHNWSGKKSTWY